MKLRTNIHDVLTALWILTPLTFILLNGLFGVAQLNQSGGILGILWFVVSVLLLLLPIATISYLIRIRSIVVSSLKKE